MAIKALVFDAYGTLYDVHSVFAKTEELCPGKGDLITQIWRLKQLEYTWLQTSLQHYRDFTFLTQAALEFALRAAGIEPTESITKPLFEDISISPHIPRPRRRSRSCSIVAAASSPFCRTAAPRCLGHWSKIQASTPIWTLPSVSMARKNSSRIRIAMGSRKKYSASQRRR